MRAAAPEATYDFVLDLLAELRRRDYRPIGWGRFLARAWRQAWATGRAHPRLVRSWALTAGGLALAEAAALDIESRLGRRAAALRAIPGTALGTVLVAFDVYAHLGMNAGEPGQPLHATLGLPTALTLARRGVAALLWGHLLGRRPVAQPVALAALLVAGATDIADGALARRTGRRTRLGAYQDAVADYEFWGGLALTLGARRLLPRWLVALLLLRFTTPFAFALASYFGWVRRVPVGSTAIGKVAGVAQAATFGAALVPANGLAKGMVAGASARRLRRLLHAGTAALLIAAPLAQLRQARGRRPL